MTETHLTDQARAMVGVTSEPGVHRVDRSQIRLFAEAIGDSNPLYVDEDYARTTRWGGIIAPPTFIYNLKAGSFPEIPLDTTRLLNGGDEFEYFGVVRPDDVILVISKWTELYERPGRVGLMVFTIWETTYTNQHGKVVAKHRATRIRY
ncbi:MAG: MaoC family dehydratase N-terminal domain-containing protein [Dehalococcoidia bacterium]